MTLKRAGIIAAVTAVAGLAGYQSLSAGTGAADRTAKPGVKMVPYFEVWTALSRPASQRTATGGWCTRCVTTFVLMCGHNALESPWRPLASAT